MLSVVIPTYRKPQMLTRTLAALETQVDTVEEGLEVVVVDDGSGDETSEVVEAFSASLPIVAAGPVHNEGRARARNRGWRAARGAWVLFLDDDIVLEPGALAAHAAAQRRRAAAYLGDVVTADEVVDSTLFEYLDTRGVAKLPPGAPSPARYFLTQNVSVPRDALVAVEGFDESFGAYGFEDMEVAFRMEDAAGLQFFRLGGARGAHIHHHSLDEYLDKKLICGRETLPRLAELHPHRLQEMRLHLLPSLRSSATGRDRLVRGLVGFAAQPGPQALLRALARRWPAAWAPHARNRVYDSLVLTSYERGLRQRASA